jgi:hypothetical protein
MGLVAGLAGAGSVALVCLSLLFWGFCQVKRGKLRWSTDSESSSRRPNPLLLSRFPRAEGTRAPGQVVVPYFIPPVSHLDIETATESSSGGPRGVRLLDSITSWCYLLISCYFPRFRLYTSYACQGTITCVMWERGKIRLLHPHTLIHNGAATEAHSLLAS